jgi:hypothetical protein
MWRDETHKSGETKCITSNGTKSLNKLPTPFFTSINFKCSLCEGPTQTSVEGHCGENKSTELGETKCITSNGTKSLNKSLSPFFISTNYKRSLFVAPTQKSIDGQCGKNKNPQIGEKKCITSNGSKSLNKSLSPFFISTNPVFYYGASRRRNICQSFK